MSALADLRLAVAFLTRIPVAPRGPAVGAGPGAAPADHAGAAGSGETARPHGSDAAPALARACAWFPLVGAGVGVLLGGSRWALELVGVPAAPATLVGVLVAIAVTGALHEDGLADLADALGAVAGPARRREIMRDPRVGASGAIAAAAAVVLPVLCLAPLDPATGLAAAVAAGAGGRLAIVALGGLLGPAGPGTSAAAARPTGGALLVAAVTGGVIVLLAVGVLDALVVLGVAALATAACGAVLVRAAGGLTGDGLGGTAKAVELATLVVLAATLG